MPQPAPDSQFALERTGAASGIAVDLGSSGGRIYVGHLRSGKLTIAEAHRFTNAPVRLHDRWYWDVLRIWTDLQDGLVRAARGLEDGVTIGIDGFGVDYGLLDRSGGLLAPVRCMRDTRTTGLHARIYQTIPADRLYRRTGAMEISINTLVQLLADHLQQPWLLEAAETLLFVPDLIAWLLTGRRGSEATIASTSQFFDPVRRDWTPDVLHALGLPARILPAIVEPGTPVGAVLPTLAGRLGLPAGSVVVATASHDTAAAFAAAPVGLVQPAAIISLGTWALLGLERSAPNLSEASRVANFSNEAGVDGSIAYHKILMGLWLLQECQRHWQADTPQLDAAALHDLAASAAPLTFLFDPDDPVFLAPHDMLATIDGWFRSRGYPVPGRIGDIVRAIYDSLALSYRRALDALEQLEGARFAVVHVVGGGARAGGLCQAVADAIGRPVIAGPVEAAALGNLIGQFVATGAVADFAQGRALVSRSFPPTECRPRDAAAWSAAYRRFASL
jgi:rhamnulokinase